eukprot:CAMPEP_0115037218 /NCGR_PEP_ID=MMETSP0216-20121206/42647_1 /TAXON_ID=223996 /ORGANISM="Protocruzia adherens, Strain Boccale" /LENGTH=173 /DNA_ID=CAMNT_0002417315 /DNA_START=58 /DNA_END=579 /DNA_ORIENTATION=+
MKLKILPLATLALMVLSSNGIPVRSFLRTGSLSAGEEEARTVDEIELFGEPAIAEMEQSDELITATVKQSDEPATVSEMEDDEPLTVMEMMQNSDDQGLLDSNFNPARIPDDVLRKLRNHLPPHLRHGHGHGHGEEEEEEEEEDEEDEGEEEEDGDDSDSTFEAFRVSATRFE